jgi:NADPH:quinone reductase-like Zn-dependent oxidoreductase
VIAVLYRRYGSPDVLELAEIDKPVPADDEVLVRVRATSVNPVEWYSMVGLPVGRVRSGLRSPKDPRLGVDMAGTIEAVGRNVTELEPGDEVFGAKNGALAEYVCVRNAIALKPSNLTFEQAAAVPVAAITALQGLRDHGRLQPGQRVLINGASGGVGTFAVQIAKALGAAHVTAVCSTQNVETARSLGADAVVDYTADDFTRSDERYDLLLDVNGTRSFSEYRRVLEPEGRLVIVGAPKGNRVIGPLAHVIKVKLGSLGRSQKVGFFVAKLTREDLLVLSELLASGKVTPVIDRSYPLSEIADAMRYLGEGHARGKIVVTV